ncbi:acyl carrier protein [uncultured Methylobacterium sp.]|uniref:acyl carrier protein n=1 Tax=uncultured Methylobacterium sp. TaxID=157278 RepID=UPI0035C9AF92
MISSHDIRETLGGIEALSGAVDRLADDDDLFDKGLCSFGSVQLMLALEERFGVEFPDHLLNRQSFATIRAIRTTVASLAQPAAT